MSQLHPPHPRHLFLDAHPSTPIPRRRHRRGRCRRRRRPVHHLPLSVGRRELRGSIQIELRFRPKPPNYIASPRRYPDDVVRLDILLLPTCTTDLLSPSSPPPPMSSSSLVQLHSYSLNCFFSKKHCILFNSRTSVISRVV
ncbi:hypothetical protein B0H12DRAFT_42259 [Mycena haematopus]|nr:hypothetical protein B0H12DRAFT_42259 [Mycena haematopus]